MSDETKSREQGAGSRGLATAGSSKGEQSKSDLITALGGIELEVTHKPASAFDPEDATRLQKFAELFGKTESVKVRQIRVRDIQKYHLNIDNEEFCADLFCSKDAGWSETLDYDSLNKVLDTGQDLNLPLWSAWFRRMMRRNEAAGPGWASIVRKVVEAAVKHGAGSKEPGESASGGSSSPSA